MKQIGIFFSLWLFAFAANAARIDSIAVQSNAMKTKVKTIVIIPNKALEAQAVRCPVIYLLHGYSGNEKDWINKFKPNLQEIVEEKGIIIVCPDGKNSWYFDSPLDETSQYETFISSELISHIDRNYNTIADKNNRAITGLSMGGCGALFNAFRHKDIFGAVGSMSGAIDISRRNEPKLLGEISQNRRRYEQLSVLNQIDKISNGDLAIAFDCGVSDFCFQENEALNKALWNKGIDHEYTIRQGKHTGEYWRNSIDYHILFFSKFFKLL